MSNGKSKIAKSKAALCCGFAIALRALFLGILPYSPSLAEGVGGGSLRASPLGERSNQQARNPHDSSLAYG